MFTAYGCGNDASNDRRGGNAQNPLGLNSQAPQQSHCQLNGFQPTALSLADQNGELLETVLARTRQRIAAPIEVEADRSAITVTRYESAHIPLIFRWGGIPLCPSQFYATAHVSRGVMTLRGGCPTA